MSSKFAGTAGTNEGLNKFDFVDQEGRETSRFGRLFVDAHLILGMFCSSQTSISRVFRLTMLLVIVILTLFFQGLFYAIDGDSNDDTGESISETFKNYNVKDFLISLYTTLILLVAQSALSLLFQWSSPRDKDGKNNGSCNSDVAKTITVLLIVSIVLAWCTYCVMMFSEELGDDQAQRWLVNFGLLMLASRIITDNVCALLTAFLQLHRE